MDNKKQITIPSSDDRNIIKIGVGIILFVFLILGGWSAFAPLATYSVAVGKISADTEKKTVQHLDGGIIKEILVKDGDEVKTGDILLKLDDTQIKSQLAILTAQYSEAVAMASRFEAQKDDKNSMRSPSGEVAKSQQNILAETQKLREEEKKINQSKIVQLQSNIIGLKSAIDGKKAKLASDKEQVAELEELFKERLVDKMKLRDLKTEISMLESDISNSNSEIQKTKQQIDELSNQQNYSDKKFKTETLTNLFDAKSKISDLQSKITAIQDMLNRTIITAPSNGIVVGMSVNTVGGTITPGKPILEIVPKNKNLVISAQVSLADIDKVAVGLLADIHFSAFNLKSAKPIEGKVRYVSADSLVSPDGKMQYYEAKVELTDKGMRDFKGYGFFLVPGMPVEVMIKTGDRTALDYIIKPMTDRVRKSFNEE